jgi:hypothetical protein
MINLSNSFRLQLNSDHVNVARAEHRDRQKLPLGLVYPRHSRSRFVKDSGPG